jgi:serine/threonine protein kinase
LSESPELTQLTSADHSQHAPTNAALPVDTVLQGRYRIVRQLGKGGMGAVYEAVDLRLGITVALKETLSSDPAVRKQFEREARLLAGMQHPALPRVSDHFTELERAFLVMEFIAGVDLARIIAQQPGPFPRNQVVVWADQLLDALIYLHTRERQVIHRDIKPHNLKLTASGQIALIDFGLAKDQPADPNSTSSSAFFGYTRQYAPLEQIQDQRTDPRSDIYALGATLYHLLTGVKPPDALLRAASLLNSGSDPLKPANDVHRAVGTELATILNKAMAQNPEDRFASATEFREALSRIGRERQVSNEPPTTGPETDRTVVASDPNPELKIAMVESSRRFGPGGITALVIGMIVLAAGLLVASQRLQTSGAERKSASTHPSAPGPTRRTERNREGASPVPSNSMNPSDEGSKKEGKEKSDASPPSEKTKPVSTGSTELERRAPKKKRQLDAPTIRLPSPNVQDTGKITS